MPPSSKPNNAYTKNAELLRAAQKEANELGKGIWPQISHKYPGLSCKPQNFVFKKHSQQYWRVYDEIALKLVQANGAAKTQVAILAELQPSFLNDKLLPNIWNKKLNTKQLKKIQTYIDTGGIKPFKIKNLKTLAEIKEAIQANANISKADVTFKATVSIGKEAVTIGNKSYPIEKRKTGKYEYPSIRVAIGKKRDWIKVNSLKALLK